METTRREFLGTLAASTLASSTLASSSIAAASAAAEPALPAIRVDPRPRFPLSPWLYMQFMEPLGTTDGSVAAAWDSLRGRWRPDVVDAARRLAPPLLRWGGCLSSYYRWREAVGPRAARRPMANLLWGGFETNEVGTAEFVDFCRQVGADPFICVNFESDGRKAWMRGPAGDLRTANADEAADWVRYANDPASAERRAHGFPDPLRVPLWQIGNETSYDPEGFDVETAARKTVEFARAMRAADPSIRLVGWGDSGWGPRMLEVAGEHLQFLAFHHMFDPDGGAPDSPLRGIAYRKDPSRTWERLMDAWKVHDARIRRMRDEVSRSGVPLALTECHFALPGRNRGDVLSTWAAGVANARLLNVHERHGDVLRIATLADFCGTRWQVNALMIPVPGGRSYLMPVGLVMALYRAHSGKEAVAVDGIPEGLDITASRTGDRLFLHVVNTSRTRATAAVIAVAGRAVRGGRVFALAADPWAEVIETDPDAVALVEGSLPAGGAWEFPAASVSAVEADLGPA